MFIWMIGAGWIAIQKIHKHLSKNIILLCWEQEELVI